MVLQKSVRAIVRLAAATAVVGLVGYVALHGVPAEIKDEVKRRETVRRVKVKVRLASGGDVVGWWLLQLGDGRTRRCAVAGGVSSCGGILVAQRVRRRQWAGEAANGKLGAHAWNVPGSFCQGECATTACLM